MKEKIINLWKSVKREGIDDLIKWLEVSDFFQAPCSTHYHFSRPGGLAEHSYNVYLLAKEKVQRYGLATPEDSIIICGLGHDLCKVNFYAKDKKNVKKDGVWKEEEVYVVKDAFPFGHGEKSVTILQDFIKLTEEEKLAIRWHMNAFTEEVENLIFKMDSAINKYPFVLLLFTADYESTKILEKD